MALLTPDSILSSEAWEDPSTSGSIALLDGIPSSEAWGTPTLLPAGTKNELLIGGVSYGSGTNRGCALMKSSWTGDRNLASGLAAQCKLVYLSGDKPQKGQEFQRFVKGVQRFAGIVDSVVEKSVRGKRNQSRIQCNFVGYQVYASRVVTANFFTIPLGGLASIIIGTLVEQHLAQFGITYVFEGDPELDLGEQTINYSTVKEALDQITAQTPGWTWEITDYKQLRYYRTDPAAGANAPFAVTRLTAGAADDIAVRRSQAGKTNRWFVVPSVPLLATWTDSDTGDGSTVAFATKYPLNSKPRVVVDGVEQLVTEMGNWIAGFQWYYIPGSNGIFQNHADSPIGAVPIQAIYPSPVPFAYIAEDLADIAANGLFENTYYSKTADTLDKLTALGNGLLALGLVGDEQVDYVYNTHQLDQWLLPGQIQSFDWTYPDFTDALTIRTVSSVEVGLHFWRHTVMASLSLGDITDEQILASLQRSTRAAMSVNSPNVAGWSLAEDLPGITNPGLAAGPISTFIKLVGDGTFASWDCIFPASPSMGADLVMDFFLNGVSIFPESSPPVSSNKIVVPAGSTAVATGFRFRTENLEYKDGDILTGTVLSVGTGAKNGVVQFHLLPRT